MAGDMDIAQAWYLLGRKDKARQLADQLWKTASQYVNFYLSLDDRGFNMGMETCRMQLGYTMANLLQMTSELDPQWSNSHRSSYGQFMQLTRVRVARFNNSEL